MQQEPHEVYLEEFIRELQNMTAPWCSPLINERSIHYSICRGGWLTDHRDKQGLHVGKRTCSIHILGDRSLVSAWLCWITYISTYRLRHVDSRSLITTVISSVWRRRKWGWDWQSWEYAGSQQWASYKKLCMCLLYMQHSKNLTPKPMWLMRL